MTGSRRKGKGAELEVVHLLQANGWPDARRSGDAGQIDGDIENGPDGMLLEVRRREALRIGEWCREVEAEAVARANGEVPVLAFRQSNQPWRAVLPLTDLLALLAERDDLLDRLRAGPLA